MRSIATVPVNYKYQREDAVHGVEYVTKYHQSEKQMFKLQAQRAAREKAQREVTAAEIPDAAPGMILLASTWRRR